MTVPGQRDLQLTPAPLGGFHTTARFLYAGGVSGRAFCPCRGGLQQPGLTDLAIHLFESEIGFRFLMQGTQDLVFVPQSLKRCRGEPRTRIEKAAGDWKIDTAGRQKFISDQEGGRDKAKPKNGG